MTLLVYVVGGLLLTWAVYLGYLWLSTQSTKGKPLDAEVMAHLPDVQGRQGPYLIYCYTEGCPPCRRMSPLMDALQEQGYPIVKADMAKDPELAELLGVRATPTVLLVEDGQIRDALLGARSQQQLLKLLGEA